jgi:hypothetical protein
LVNVRPGQQAKLFSVALGDPNVFEATPDGQGRNWTLVAVSASRGAVAVSSDGTVVDLTKDGAVTGEAIAAFSDPALAKLDLKDLDMSGVIDSDSILSRADADAREGSVSIALLTPVGLGLGPFGTEDVEPMLVYQLFSVEPDRQLFALFDALTGRPLLADQVP